MSFKSGIIAHSCQARHSMSVKRRLPWDINESVELQHALIMDERASRRI